MFEARFETGETLIKIVDAMKELVEDCNIDCSTTGMSMQVSAVCTPAALFDPRPPHDPPPQRRDTRAPQLTFTRDSRSEHGCAPPVWGHCTEVVRRDAA